ncbi:TPA: hypothetical protein ACGW7B_001795 [Bacillus nitratireducens]|nr:hypothetical protein bcere0029_10360 [Bacillus cereus AH1272]EEL94945.1 hypothetical protein bcere0030_10520 [Bacillus cereus AH1273]GCF73389.1 hypothetical protein BC2926_09300 [Bacillus cereus]
MKATKLVSLAIPVLLLAGCGVSEKSSEPKTETVSKEDNKQTVSAREYPSTILDYHKEFYRQLDPFGTSFDSFLKGVGSKHDLLDVIDNSEAVLDKIANIEPPSEYKDDHEKIIEGIKSMKGGFKEINQAINDHQSDADIKTTINLVRNGTDNLQKGNEEWTPSLNKLFKINKEGK